MLQRFYFLFLFFGDLLRIESTENFLPYMGKGSVLKIDFMLVGIILILLIVLLDFVWI